MAQLRQDFEIITHQDAVILVVGPENTRAFQDYWQKHNLPFIGLPNPELTVLKLFGQEVNLFKLGRMPAQVIIDKSGVARFVHYGNAMSDIPSTQQLLTALNMLNRETTQP